MQNMVYLHFPSNLTEEELMLQAKYNKLKRKVHNEVMFTFFLNVKRIMCVCTIIAINYKKTKEENMEKKKHTCRELKL